MGTQACRTPAADRIGPRDGNGRRQEGAPARRLARRPRWLLPGWRIGHGAVELDAATLTGAHIINAIMRKGEGQTSGSNRKLQLDWPYNAHH